ncbi:MAG: chemotaxis protein CheR [Candidatus Riflebacteria bacterium HGW-Riflebacteria-2]|nr:MAG: chemotaxis protein CheR [Candidatus Riflebacteria bacterium HGW-Riflebacteria-2]
MKDKLDSNEFALWSQFLAELTGISLSEDKEYLIIERFHGLLKKYQCSNYSHLYFMAREPDRNDLREELIDHITTKETSFFRDSAPFEVLRKTVLPKLLEHCRRTGEKRRLKIWSAACSTGQEAYSLAMVLQEMGVSPQEYLIMGTDISRMAIESARHGCYNRFEVERGVPPALLERFFVFNSKNWQVKDSLKESLSFTQMPLHRPFMLPDSFDLIVCRNVAIYFSSGPRVELFNRVARHLQPHGYLLIGSTETLGDLAHLFCEVQLEPRVVFLQNADKRQVSVPCR